MARTPNRGPQGGTTLQGGRINIYHSQLTNPVTPPPSMGDMYFNTSIREWMFYDLTRVKWLSMTTMTTQVGRSGNLGGGVYYRGVNGMILDGVTRSIGVPQGTLTGISVSKTSVAGSTIEVVVNTAVIASLVLPASAGITQNHFLNADFPQGNLAVRNSATGNTVQNSQIVLWYKRRT